MGFTFARHYFSCGLTGLLTCALLTPQPSRAQDFGGPVTAAANNAINQSTATVNTASAAQQSGTGAVTNANNSLQNANSNFTDSASVTSSGASAVGSLSQATAAYQECIDGANNAIAQAVAGGVATQAQAQAIEGGNCSPKKSNPATQAEGQSCSSAVTMARVAGLAAIAMQIAAATAKRDECQKQKQDAEAQKPGAQQVADLGKSKTVTNTSTLPTTNKPAEVITTAVTKPTTTTDSSRLATLGKAQNFDYQDSPTASLPSGGPDSPAGAGYYQGLDNIEKGFQEEAARKRGLASTGEKSEGSYYQDKKALSMAGLGINNPGPEDQTGLQEIQTPNDLQAFDAYSGFELSLWQRATRRYMGPGLERMLFLSRMEEIRHQAGAQAAGAPPPIAGARSEPIPTARAH